MKYLLIISILLISIISEAKELNIVTSIKPLYSLINGIIGNESQNHLIVSKNHSIHDYSLKPSDIRSIKNSKLLFLIDYNFETYVKKISKVSNNLKIIEISKIPGIKLLETRHNDLFSINHDHKHGNIDYHLWLDFDNVIKIIDYVTNILSENDYDNSIIYKSNAEIIKDKITIVNNNIKHNLKPYYNIPYMVSHDAYQYFEKYYNLNSVGTVSYGNELNLSIKKYNDLNSIIRNKNIKCIFSEANHHSDVIYRLAKDNKIKTNILDAEWGSDKDNIDGYIETLENITNNIVECLK